MMRFIKYHPQSNTYVIEKRAFFDEDLILDGNVIVGQDVNFWKDLRVTGSLELGKGSIVRGNVKAQSALICSGAKILGSIDTLSELVMLDGARINFAFCKGDVYIRPGCAVASVKAEGTLELIGKVTVKKVEPLTKVVVRAEE
ncbi:polymer-forming cytoskeletal protein [Methanosarcina sp. KYL-1]|uniref:polymer-forming cytoskeletal protein n=1 Tax=Methanosarcina sp. KYL-1 TaxID=2602068 RepID=UPI00210117CA|nr:polymer-forming cytoskeletal protein [Methanosarcina sp. KYL-1]MCQ1535990.1 polymer-forming cytoskeletal protein [Methanosarcina sp. KYL-1]